MNNSSAAYYFPNKLGRMLLLAFEEVMGKTGINAALTRSSPSFLIDNYHQGYGEQVFSFKMIGQLQSVLEQVYGPHGGRGIALRAGRVFFSLSLRKYGPRLGLNTTSFRLEPPSLKLMDVLKYLTDFFNGETNQRVTLEETERTILWRIDRCPWCWGRHTFEPTCHFHVGLLQEALYWVSGGKFYNVEEETCIGQGDTSCLIVVSKIALN